MAQKLKIENGPSFYELMVALGSAPKAVVYIGKIPRIPISFYGEMSAESWTQMYAEVDGVVRETHDGDWIVTGEFITRETYEAAEVLFHKPGKSFTARYSTKTRKGTYTLKKK